MTNLMSDFHGINDIFIYYIHMEHSNTLYQPVIMDSSKMYSFVYNRVCYGAASGCPRRLIYYTQFYYIPYVLTEYFPIMRSVRYQPVIHTLYFMPHHTHVLHNVVRTTIIEMVEILDGRVGIAFS